MLNIQYIRKELIVNKNKVNKNRCIKVNMNLKDICEYNYLNIYFILIMHICM